MQKLIDELGIEEGDFKAPPKRAKRYTKVKDVAFPFEDYNFMADLLILPKTKKGNRYLLVVVDLATNEFDFQEMKTKTPKAVLDAYMKMIKRPYINKAEASIRVDDGSEFKGVFERFLYDESILKRTAMPNRKTQMANVERLNGELGRIINGFMNTKELKTNKKFVEWDNVAFLNKVREKLNDFRKVQPRALNTMKHKPLGKSKYKVGDVVQYRLDTPEDALGNKQPTSNFRKGDRRFSIVGRKIKQVLKFPKMYRYILSSIPNVSYTEQQLRPMKDVEKFVVKKLLDKKKIKGRVHYLVWWKNYKKSEATWESATTLKKEVPELIKAFNVTYQKIS